MCIHCFGGEILREKCAERLSGAGKKVIEKAFIDMGERSPSVAYNINLPFHPCMFYFDLPEHISLKLIPYSTSGYNRYTHFFLYRLLDRIGRTKQTHNFKLLWINALPNEYLFKLPSCA